MRRKRVHGLQWMITCALAWFASGCYEGWEYDKKKDESTTPIPQAGPAPFSFILFESFVLAPDALADENCFRKRALVDYRRAEWTERIAALTAALQPLAEHFVAKQRPISKSDCATLSTIRTASIDSTPWAPEQAPGADPKDRKIVHFKAVFWQEDLALDPPWVVLEPEWVAWRIQSSSGRRTLSAHHFVIAKGSEGYFRTWRESLDAGIRIDGRPILEIDASDAGITQRRQHVEEDTKAVVAWLQERQ